MNTFEYTVLIECFDTRHMIIMLTENLPDVFINHVESDRGKNGKNHLPAWSSSDQQSTQEEQFQNLQLCEQRDKKTGIGLVKH